MTLKQATEIVQQYQYWRLGKIDEILYTPSAITEALDMLIDNSKIPVTHSVERIMILFAYCCLYTLIISGLILIITL